MSLYRTSKGFGVDWRDEFGRRHRKFIGSEEAARRMNAELQSSGAMAHQALHHYRASEALSLSDGIDLYIAGLPVAPVTKRNQTERLKHAAERMGNPRLTDVTPQLLDAHTQVRRAELAPSSLAKEQQILKQVFNFLVSKWYLPTSPADHLQANLPRRSVGRCITPAEELRILAVCTFRIRTKILSALDAGLRLGECNRLQKNHYNASEGTLTVWSSKTRMVRTIPLTPRLQNALEKISARLAPDTHLFAYGGREVKKGSDALKKIRPKARVQFRFHDLRHSFATRLAAVAVNPHVTRVLLGHAPRQTTDLYVHPPIEECRQSIMLMAEVNHAAAQHAAQEQTP